VATGRFVDIGLLAALTPVTGGRRMRKFSKEIGVALPLAPRRILLDCGFPKE
jgi:hypothetical protein